MIRGTLLRFAMKVFTLLLLCASLATTLLLGGCASDVEDRNFFERGWRHPSENDARMGYR